MPPRSATSGDQPVFRDINLNILAGKYRRSAPRIKPVHMLLILTIIIGLALLFPVNRARSQVYAETDRLQTELSGIRQQIDQALLSNDEAKQTQATIDKIIADTDAVKQERQSLVSQGGDFASNMKLVTGALPARAYFTSIGIGTDQITVDGEADSAFTVVNYVTALEALSKFSEVRIVRIDESQKAGGGTTETDISGVSFEIVVTKQA